MLAGGCFWGMQGVFEHVKGVKQVLSGYSGGTVKDPGYELVSSGSTGHAESVQIKFPRSSTPTTNRSMSRLLMSLNYRRPAYFQGLS